MSKKIKAILALSALLLLTGALSLFLVNRAVGDGSLPVDFEVKKGEGTIIIANHLQKEKLISSALFFRIITLLTGNEGDLQTGLYPLHNAMSLTEIVSTLTSGKTKAAKVTIPEGYNNRQIGDALVEAGLLSSQKEFLDAAQKPELLKKHNIAGKTFEGYLFPETYNIPFGYEAGQIIELMYKTFQEHTRELEGFPSTPQEVHQLVILASIVEREAQKKEERPLIAGVFSNRLEESYPLESCATIQYLFEKPKKRLLFKDLEIKSPYNTYKNAGLPPGPISNPGLPAIEATLHPVKTRYKFFVVKPDGSHYFSKTFNEHVRAKNKYIGK